MKKTILALCAVICGFSGNAYNAKNHVEITQHAIYLLNKSFGHNYICPHEAELIIHGCKSEDASFFKLFTRAYNKHFYNPTKDSRHWERPNAIDVRFKRLVNRLYGRVDQTKYYYSVGEVVHHMQDASCPSHVVPIYHGPGRPDAFDKQCISCLLPKKLRSKDAEISKKFPFKLHEDIALETLDNIKNSTFTATVYTHGVKEKKTMNWTAFWQENPCGWFGKYGEVGKPRKHGPGHPDNYLKQHICKGCVHYVVPPSAYDNFTRKQLDIAVENTALFIFYAKEYGKKHHKEFHHCH
jgi:hypothetical protein